VRDRLGATVPALSYGVRASFRAGACLDDSMSAGRSPPKPEGPMRVGLHASSTSISPRVKSSSGDTVVLPDGIEAGSVTAVEVRTGRVLR
jgi:hypothetical protein